LHFLIKSCLARFGVLVQVLIDQGREILGPFDEICVKALIDHRTTSWDHPISNGLTKWVVQTIKCGWWKYGIIVGSPKDFQPLGLFRGKHCGKIFPTLLFGHSMPLISCSYQKIKKLRSVN